MALSLGDFYGRTQPARRSSALSGDLNASLHSFSTSYRPNKSLTHMQVTLSDLDDEQDLSSLASYARESTPISNRRFTPRGLLPSTSQQSVLPSGARVLGMLQEQQSLLRKLIQDQQEIQKKNDKRIALVLKDHTESSSSSSSSEKKRRSVTKELTVSRAPNDVQVMYYKISFRTKLPKFTMP